MSEDKSLNYEKMSEEEWRQRLSETEYQILREKGTERPFSGKYLSLDKDGVYRCAGCGQALFDSHQQFEAHCGWPSFDKAIEGAVEYVRDSSHGMIRTEIICSRCKGHLGHVFDDGPTATGQRYCVNSIALKHESD